MIRADQRPRRIRRRPPQRRVPPPVEPTGVQLGYYADLRRMVRRLAAILEKRLGPLLDSLPDPEESRSDDARLDAPPDGGWLPDDFDGDLEKALRQAAEEWSKEFPARKLEALAGQVGDRANKHQRQQWVNQVKAVAGVEPTKLEPWVAGEIKAFVRENVALIKTIPAEALDQVREHVLEAASKGARHESLRKVLVERMGVAQSRAKVIARDQINKLNGQLTERRQAEAGVKEYIWRTVRDARVRSAHRELDGKRFAWSKPPPEGHPGTAVQCRCYAEPDLSAALEFL